MSPHTITPRSVRRFQEKFKGKTSRPTIGNGGHPTKKHTPGRMRHMSASFVNRIGARKRYLKLLNALQAAANYFKVGKS